MDTCKCKLDAHSADEWALEVQARALDYIDFADAEARYHRNC